MEARIKLQSMELKKSGHNKFAGYKYFELGDFLPQIQDIFNKIGLCSFISFTSEYATLTIIDTEDNSQVVFTSPMAEANLKGSHAIQNIGAVETYSRRYLYVSALEIVEHDAIDASEPVVPASAKPITVDVFSNMSEQEQQEIRSYGVDVIALLSKSDVEGAVEYINMLELGADEKTALWSLLDSKQRSAIKKFTTR
jgi:hypothetical protein